MGGKQFKKELMQKTIIYLMALFVVLFALTGSLYGWNLYQGTELSNRQFLELLKTQTLHFLEHPLGELATIESQLRENEAIIIREPGDYHKYIIRIEQLNAQGEVMASYPEEIGRLGMDMTGNSFINNLNDKEYHFSDTFVDYINNETAMMIGKRLSNGNYLVGYMNLDKLSSAFSSFKKADSIFAIMDNKGNYLVHPLEDNVSTRAVDDHSDEIRTGKIKSGDLVFDNGRLKTIEYTLIDGTEWYLLIYQDFLGTYGSVIITLAVMLASMLIAFYFVLRSFNYSFNRLALGFTNFINMTKKVAEGDYQAIKPEQPFAEFEELSHNFMTMIGDIESREEEIQKYNFELNESKEELKASNDELYATLQQLMAIEKAHRDQNENLDRQNRRLENLIEGTHAGTWEWDILTDEVVINRRWAEILDYELDEVVPFSGSKFFQMVHLEDMPSLKQSVNAVFEDAVPFFDVRFRMKNRHGNWVWINSIAKVIRRDDQNRPLLMTGIHMDITKSVEYENGLIESKELANAANVAKGQFLANMSHEIRTPLNGISGYLTLIHETTEFTDVRDYSKAALKVTQSMVRLIDDILDFSRIEAGKLKLVNEAIDVHEKLHEVINLYRYETHEKNIKLSHTISKEVPKAIIGDATRIKQIMTNLISNAIKFSVNGEVTIDVDVNMTTKKQGVLSFSVTDSGIGIPPEQIKAIFEPFNQGDNSSKRRFGGTGLGLAIVKQLVELMAGSIDVESAPGRGSRFIVQIPFVSAEDEIKKGEEALMTHSKRDVKAKILVVDDNDINQMVVRKVLEIKGFECEIASNGEEAVAAVLKNNYDCVFMDVQMPVMDGYDATKKIREMKPRDEVFIVAMTANAMSGDREKCIEAGMDDYVSKPLNYDQMTDMVLKRLQTAK